MASEKSEIGTTEVSGGGAISDEEWNVVIPATHRERTSGIGIGHCVACRGVWPCEAVRLLDALDASEARAEAAERLLDYSYMRQKVESLEAERDVLREAVRLHMDLSNHHLAAKCPYCRGN